MSRVVVFGLGPMRWEQSTRLFALPLRTWHFAATLARDRHEVLLFSMRTAAFEGWPPEKVTKVERDGVTIYSLSEHLLHERPDWVQARIAEFGPDCIVGVNKDPAAVAVNFAGELPFWADINGDPMAEAQAKAEAVGTDIWTGEFHRRFTTALMRGDVFSTCSTPQRHALIGQLSMTGRLTGPNAGYEMVHAVPNSIDDEELRLLSTLDRPPRRPSDPFVLLWSGGYNTWCDPDLLYEAVDRAMTEAPQLRFVSTGGAIGGHYTEGYDRFRERVARSGHKERYHFAGWVQTAELPAYYGDAHAAVLTDRFGYEGLLGARTRMLDWLAAGLPIVTTRLSEISVDLESVGAALCSECENIDAMTQNILRLVRQPALAVEMGARGRRHASERLRAARQLDALREWAAAPRRAPDGERRVEMPRHDDASNEVKSLARMLAARTKEVGVRGSLGDVGRFAARRAKHRVQRVLDKAGLPGGVEVIELTTPQAAPAEAPRLGALQWRERLSRLDDVPAVAVVLLVDAHDNPDVLDWTVEQVARQYYDAWDLVIGVQSSTPALHARLDAIQARLADRAPMEVVDCATNNPFEHHAVNRADFVALLGVGDLLRPDALAEMVTHARDRGADVVYADEQDVDETNAPRPVDRKPDWSPELLLSRPFLGGCAIFRRAGVDIAHERARAWPAAPLSYHLALSATEGATTSHLDRVLCQRYRPLRGGSAGRIEAERRVGELCALALNDAIWRRRLDATVEPGRTAGTFRVRHRLPPATDVTLVIPAVGPAERLARCLRAIEARTEHDAVELVVAVDPDAPPLPRGDWLVARLPRRISIGAQIDAVLRERKSTFVAWVLPEAEVVRAGWLDELVRQAGRDGAGAAAPKLLEPSGRLAWPRRTAREHVHEVSQLPFQCALMSRERYLEAGGLGAGVDLKAAVDALADRLDEAGYTLLYTPYASLYLHPDPQVTPARESRQRSA
ncbi:MAG: glycosyltransferase [Sandaracinaceae bacterium]